MSRPIVIAHRGACAYLPEHTLPAYRLAIEQGADFIEPDLVLTRDGVPIARHDNTLSLTTDVADRPAFAGRRTAKTVDGQSLTDWFAEDFTLAEIKSLRARERWPALRPGSARHDGQFEIPTLVEILDLAKEMERAAGRRVGIYPETKHPTYFAYEGRYSDGTPIGRNLGRILVETLAAEGFVDPARVYIQSFEIAGLIELKTRILPESGLRLPLVQLLGDTSEGPVREGAFSAPYDVIRHLARGADLAAVYGPSLAPLLGAGPGYGRLVSPAVLDRIAEYADGLGPWLGSLLPRERADAPAGGKTARPARTRLTGQVSPLLALARERGLQVHPYTLRPEEPFLALWPDGSAQTFEQAVFQLLSLGASGFFADDPLAGRRAADAWLGAGAGPSTVSVGASPRPPAPLKAS